MNMLEIHAEELETDSGPYHEFLLMYRASRRIVYGFVEGREDPSYYRGFIENFLPEGWTVRLIQSGSKRTVMEIFLSMPWSRFSKRRICFFVDRDLSDYLDEESVTGKNFYITDNYSIENDVVNGYVFERVMEEIFGISYISEEEREAVYNQFEANLHAFCEAMVPVMAQILIWRKNGVRAALANIKPQALFLFRNGRLETAAHYASPKSRVAYSANCVGLSPSDDDLLLKAELEFCERSGLSRFVRGKYLIWLFVESAVSLHGAIAHYCSRYAKPPRVRVTLGAGNAMTIIAPRARIPNSLKQFIETNYLVYIADGCSARITK
jgi:hypothetical protein